MEKKGGKKRQKKNRTKNTPGNERELKRTGTRRRLDVANKNAAPLIKNIILYYKVLPL